MAWEFVEFEGKVAVTLGWSADYDEPITRRSLWIHPTCKWDAWQYGAYKNICLASENVFTMYDDRSRTHVSMSTAGWIQRVESKPICPPSKGGKSWSWEWVGGMWHKDYK